MGKILGLLIFQLGLCSYVHAAVLCAPKSGQGTIRIREVCKKNEVQLDLVALGLLEPGAVVRDANESFVGTVYYGGSVLRQVGEIAVEFPVTKAGLIQEGLGLYHESTDCSGPALMAASTEELLLVRGWVRGTTVYYPPSSGSIKPNSVSFTPISAADCWSVFIPPNICCDVAGNVPAIYGPPGTINLSHLVSPFHVEVQE
jgi:hypothetical protein